MSDTTPSPERGDAERIYSAPADAVEAARSTLSSPVATGPERGEALWVLGRSAYYANQVSDAVRLLREAVPLVDDPAVLTEILLTLAPALSKDGQPEAALGMLENPTLGLDPKYAGQLRNQRGIVLTELGRLPEALTQMTEALGLLQAAGDVQRETRTLVNLGAVASMMGELDDATRWYALAREKTIATGQHVVAAGIEGNLGYVESRRGNFSRALDWYGRARASFEGFGDVDLLVSVLEVDHARTLVDVGLAADAVDAAERATRSATAGGNQMLETQSRLLLAEALIELGDHRAAERELRRGVDLARRLGQRPWELRAADLRTQLHSGFPDAELTDDAVELDQFLAAGWVREGYRSALERARRIRRSEPERARALLRSADQRTAGLDVDPIDRWHGALVVAAVDRDLEAADRAFDRALEAVAAQRDMLGSVEVRSTIFRRVAPIRELALAVALDSPQPAARLLDVIERTRAVREPRVGRDRADGRLPERIAALRSARIALDETKLEGGDVAAAETAVREIEREILQQRRSVTSEGTARRHASGPDLDDLPADTGLVTFVVHERELLAIKVVGALVELIELGPIATIVQVVRAQRSALRRMADERRTHHESDLAQLRDASSRLDALVVAPLGLDDVDRVVVAPAAQLSDLAWSALPSLASRPVTVAAGLGAWTDDRGPITIERIALLGGPGLVRGASELAGIGRIWDRPTAAQPEASCQDAERALLHGHLVHVAAHGSFRSDNPFFSSLVFADGDLSLLEMSELESLPSVVVLSSCDAAAAASTGSAPDVVIGTATELHRLGARIVIAPTVAVNDAAAGELSVALHRLLATGATIDESMLGARLATLESGDPRRIAAAYAFQVIGGRSTRLPLVLGS